MSTIDLSLLEAETRYYLKEKQRSHLCLFIKAQGQTYHGGGKFVFIFVFSILKLLY